MNWSNEWKKPIGATFADGTFCPILPENFKANLGEETLIEAIVDIATNTIIIQDGNIKRTVTVEIIGDLALEFDDTGWCMYHVPTLSKFDKAVPYWVKDNLEYNQVEMFVNEPCYEYDKDELLRWMKKVQENYPTSWTMLRCLTPENYKDKGQSAKDIIMKWCLSVKVE